MQNLEKVKFILGNNNIIKFFLIIVLNLFQTLLEIISLGLIIPIMSAIIEPNLNNVPKFMIFISEIFDFSNNVSLIKILLLILFLIYTLKVILTILFRNYQLKFHYSLIRFVTIKIVKKYLTLDYEHYLKSKTSKMISTVYNEANSFVDWYVIPLIVIVSEFIFAISVLALLLFVDIKTTLIIVTIFVLFALVFLLLTRSKIQKWGLQRQSLAENLLKNLSDIFEGIKVIKIFQKENFFLEVFTKNQKNMQSLIHKNDLVLFLPRVMLEYLVLISIMIILLIAIQTELDLSKQIPIIALYAAAALKLIPTASKIMVSFQNMKFGAPTITRVYDEIKIENKLIENKSNMINDFKSIEFKDISFWYNQDEQSILKNASFKINTGEFIGIVGESGSGKTTLLNIILGLINPKRGKIFIDNKDETKNYPNFRKLFSLVSQDVFLFDDSVASNIALEFDNKDIDEEKLRLAIRLSQLENFIKNEKDNIYANVGEKGISVSGGQKQRISIARALYRGTKILVLDEATSNLDIETEREIN